MIVVVLFCKYVPRINCHARRLDSNHSTDSTAMSFYFTFDCFSVQQISDLKTLMGTHNSIFWYCHNGFLVVLKSLLAFYSFHILLKWTDMIITCMALSSSSSLWTPLPNGNFLFTPCCKLIRSITIKHIVQNTVH